MQFNVYVFEFDHGPDEVTPLGGPVPISGKRYDFDSNDVAGKFVVDMIEALKEFGNEYSISYRVPVPRNWQGVVKLTPEQRPMLTEQEPSTVEDSEEEVPYPPAPPIPTPATQTGRGRGHLGQIDVRELGAIDRFIRQATPVNLRTPEAMRVMSGAFQRDIAGMGTDLSQRIIIDELPEEYRRDLLDSTPAPINAHFTLPTGRNVDMRIPTPPELPRWNTGDDPVHWGSATVSSEQVGTITRSRADTEIW